MKKTSWTWKIGLCALIGAAVMGSAYAASAASISADEAKAIAIQHAGVKAADIHRIHVKSDDDYGRWIYEVEFWANATEYDYDIAQDSGEILKYSTEQKGYRHHGYRHQGKFQSNAAVSLSDAKAKALARVPGAGDSNIHIRQDYDDGRLTYEGKIIYGGVEYDFEIDAATGNILEWDEDRD